MSENQLSDTDTVPVIPLRLDRTEYNALLDAAGRLHVPVSVVLRSVIADALERNTAPILQAGRY